MIIERNVLFVVLVLSFQDDVMSHLSLYDVKYEARREKTKREIFLAEIDLVVP